MISDSFHPCPHCVKSLLIRDIERDDYSISSPVKVCGQGAESLLSGCVPNLDGDLRSIRLHGVLLLAEVDAKSCDVLIIESLTGVLVDDGGLAYSGVTQSDEL